MTERRLAAILVADVVGYSTLVGKDEAGTLAKLSKLRHEIIEPAIGKHAGRLFKSVGDGFLVEFASAVQAVTAAQAIQQANAAGALSLRIGIHLGDVVVQGDDLLGDGINIAARIEGVAEPGGIAISRAVHEQVRDKLSVAFADKGAVELKNIARPVRVFVVAAGGPAPVHSVLALPDKPSIAVLPFQNMSGDPEQEYFVDGLVEDIITALSRFRQLFVIARNSSFAYKAKAVDIKQVGRELGVRYVLEGSVRKSAGRVRITGQLIDAVTGSHLWAERYDRDLQDVFEVQEELTLAIVAALVPQMESSEMARSRGKRPASLAAHELVYRAFAEILDAYNRSNGPMCDAAIETARKAIALDPASSPAWTIVCFGFSLHLLHGRAADIATVCAEAFAAGNKAVEADPLNPNAFMMRGLYQCNNADFAAGLQDLNHAFALNPNDATLLYVLGYFQAMNGDAEDGMASIERAIRLSPKDFWRPTMHQNLAFACAVGHRYAEGVEAALVARREMPSMAAGFTTLALNYVGLGEIGKARAVIDELRKVAPQVLDMRVSTGWACQRPEDAHRLKSFMRIAAGLEEPAKAQPALALPDKPSIAVLPFQNMSGDPEQEYFADGMVEDIITALSRFKSLFVIARNSSFTYKGRAVDIKQVGRELGVRYVLEGSVRKAAGQVRITGQLIDCQSGSHLWADRFDAPLKDIFDLQDQVTSSVVSAIAPKIDRAEIERARRKPPGNLDAYDLHLRALARMHEHTKESWQDALRQFRLIIELAPDYVPPYAMAARCHAFLHGQMWSGDADQVKADVRRLAVHVATAGQDDAVALGAAGYALFRVCEDDDMGAGLVDQALALNRNLAMAWAYRGAISIFLGDFGRGLKQLNHGMRLNPLDLEIYWSETIAGHAYLALGKYAEAVKWATLALVHRPSYMPAVWVLSTAHVLAGNLADGLALMPRIQAGNPEMRLSNLVNYVPTRRPEVVEKFAEAMRLAGMPE
jgi:adenylate cyclase